MLLLISFLSLILNLNTQDVSHTSAVFAPYWWSDNKQHFSQTYNNYQEVYKVRRKIKSTNEQPNLQEFGIKLHPGTNYNQTSKTTVDSSNHCENLAYQTLKALPREQSNYLQDLTIYYTDTGIRGLAGGSTMILRCKGLPDTEFVSVMVHEMGHIVDTGLKKGDSYSGNSKFKDGSKAIYNNDPSLQFYQISFINSNTRKTSAQNNDFVSGYAKVDPFEDFAESYNFYILHGDEFRYLTNNNNALKQKYNYIKNQIFYGQEFGKGIKSTSVNKRPYDATKLAYSMTDFLKN